MYGSYLDVDVNNLERGKGEGEGEDGGGIRRGNEGEYQGYLNITWVFDI